MGSSRVGMQPTERFPAGFFLCSMLLARSELVSAIHAVLGKASLPKSRLLALAALTLRPSGQFQEGHRISVRP